MSGRLLSPQILCNTLARATTSLQHIMCIFCPDKPPDKVSRKGAGGAAQQAMLDAQNNPNVFAVGLKDACW